MHCYLFQGISATNNRIQFCLIQFNPIGFREEKKQKHEEINIAIQYKSKSGVILMERVQRFVVFATDKVWSAEQSSNFIFWRQVLDDNMSLGVLNVGDKEATFEAMDFIKHKDSLRWN